jgi:hypothetical protein
LSTGEDKRGNAKTRAIEEFFLDAPSVPITLALECGDWANTVFSRPAVFVAAGHFLALSGLREWLAASFVAGAARMRSFHIRMIPFRSSAWRYTPDEFA